MTTWMSNFLLLINEDVPLLHTKVSHVRLTAFKDASENPRARFGGLYRGNPIGAR